MTTYQEWWNGFPWSVGHTERDASREERSRRTEIQDD